MQKVRLFNKRFIISIVVVLSFLTLLFLFFAKQAKSVVTARIIAIQQILAKSHASNISTFFDDFSKSVSVLSQSKAITGSNSEAGKYLDVFVEEWRHSGIVSGAIITDEKGIVINNSNILGTHDLGKSVADREYFKWAKSAKVGDVVVGKLIISRVGASEGNVIVPVVSPIYKDGKFSGALVASVEMHKLTDRYINLTNVGDDDTYLVDVNKDILYSSKFPEGAGKSFDKFWSSDAFEGGEDLIKIFKDKRLSFTDEKIITKRYLGALSPIKLNNNDGWIIVSLTDAKEVNSFAIPLYLRIWVLIILAGSTMFVFGIFAGRNYRRN